MKLISTALPLLLFAAEGTLISTALPLLLFAAEGTQARKLSKKTKNTKNTKNTKKTKKTKNGALSTCIGRYPGYLGPNDLSGSKVTVAFDGDDGEDMFFKYNLKGAVSGCTDCGIHIHTGTTCDDKDIVGGHYWDPDKTIDLWTTAGGTVYNTPATATSTTGSFSLNNGFDVEGNDSHAVVVHDSTGARYGCGVLSTSRKAAKGCKAPKKTKKGALSTCIGRYPGYVGPNDLSGSKVTVAFDGDDGEGMLLKYNLKGAAPGCADCGLHIHTGKTCDDKDLVGGHYWDPAKTIDLWTTAGGTVYNTPATATSTTGSFSLTNGFDAEGNDSHAVVVHDSTGARYGCGVLSTSRKAAKGCKASKKPKKIVLEACVDKYPGYEGSLDISGKIEAKYYNTSSGKVTVEYNLKGADADCETCGLHIHTGTTCDDKNLVGGHYWDSGKVEDPWTTNGGAIYTSKSDGKAKGKFTLDAGYDVAANDGHAVVVHDKATGARYGCGILSSSKKLKGSCK